MKRRLQNRIARSKATFGWVFCYAVAVGAICFLLHNATLWSFILVMMSAFGMLFLNKTFSLLRIYSRMISCSYLLLSIMAGMLFMPWQSVMVSLYIILFYVILFQAYQDKNATGRVFYAFAMIGIASLSFIQVLFYVPFLWFALFFSIQAFTSKTFIASILGLLIPYWFIVGYFILTSQTDVLYQYVMSITSFGKIADISTLTINNVMTFVIVSVLALTGTIHFLRNSYFDKIRTRVFYEIFMIMLLLTAVFIVLQPQHFNALIGIYVVCCSPLIGHFLALTDTKTTNCAFFLIFFGVLIATFYNIWTVL